MKIICQICNKDFKSYGGLRGHLRTHKINTKEYEDKYGIIDSNTIKTNTCKICKTKIKLKSIYCSNICKFSDKEYNQKRGIKVEVNDISKLILHKPTNKTFKDINNLSGNLTKYCKKIGIEFNKRLNTTKSSDNKFWATIHFKYPGNGMNIGTIWITQDDKIIIEKDNPR